MKIQIGRKYLDSLGNVSIAQPHKGFFGDIKEGTFEIVHLDNITFEYKHTVGRTGYIVDFHGKIVDGAKKCPLDIKKRFTAVDELKLFISRTVFKLAKLTSNNIIKNLKEL